MNFLLFFFFFGNQWWFLQEIEQFWKKKFLIFFLHKSLVFFAKNREILKKCVFFSYINHWCFLQKIMKFWLLKTGVRLALGRFLRFLETHFNLQVENRPKKVKILLLQNAWEIWFSMVKTAKKIIKIWLLKTDVHLAMGRFLRVLEPNYDLQW